MGIGSLSKYTCFLLQVFFEFLLTVRNQLWELGSNFWCVQSFTQRLLSRLQLLPSWIQGAVLDLRIRLHFLHILWEGWSLCSAKTLIGRYGPILHIGIRLPTLINLLWVSILGFTPNQNMIPDVRIIWHGSLLYKWLFLHLGNWHAVFVQILTAIGAVCTISIC